MLRRLIGEDIELTASLDPAIGRVKADPGQLEQVLMNLAVNARDAMPQGGHDDHRDRNGGTRRESTRSTHPECQLGRYVMLAVTDTGTGMSPESQSAHLRAILHHQRRGQGDRAGSGHGPRYRQAERRVHRGLQRTRHRHHVQDLLPRGGRAGSLHPPRPDRPLIRHGAETILLVEDNDAVRRFARPFLAISRLPDIAGR